MEWLLLPVLLMYVYVTYYQGKEIKRLMGDNYALRRELMEHSALVSSVLRKADQNAGKKIIEINNN